jgi:senataxin
VLVCAPSNTAVDELAFRMCTQGVLGSDGNRNGDLNIVRIGMGSKRDKDSFDVRNSSQINDVVEKLSLDYLVDERRKAAFAEKGTRGFMRDAEKPISVMDIRKSILEKADVVCCTLSGAGSQPILEVVMHITGFKFDAVIIDEAAQAVEPSTLIPFKFNPARVVMVGDPCQLPATVFSRDSKGCNYDQSLFQRLRLAGHPVLMLETQYRMHEAIAEYPSQRFYEGNLNTDSKVTDSGSHDKQYHLHPSGNFGPVVFHNICASLEIQQNAQSISNVIEAEYIRDLYASLHKLYPQHSKNVGIIAPYKSQWKLLQRLFSESFGSSMGGVEISTVDGFQGREKDIVIFSCVRANNYGGIGFLKEWQRLNVAITRAKYALWIVGHAKTLSCDSEWRQLVNFMKDKNYILNIQPSKKNNHKNVNENKGNNNMNNNNKNNNYNKNRKNNNFNNHNNYSHNNSNNDYNHRNNSNYNDNRINNSNFDGASNNDFNNYHDNNRSSGSSNGNNNRSNYNSNNDGHNNRGNYNNINNSNVNKSTDNMNSNSSNNAYENNCKSNKKQKI